MMKHLTRTIAFSPNRKLFISVGSSCNACVEKEKVRASVIEMNPDGSGFANVSNDEATELDPDWQPLPISPFKNRSKKCKALPGDYRNHGQCVKAQ